MENKVNLYIMIGTIPSLYAQINIFLDKTPSYIWLRNIDQFIPENEADNLIYSHEYGIYYSDYEYMSHGYMDIVNKINEIKKSNKEVKYNVFVDDTRVQYILKPLIEAGIYDDIEKFIMVYEGSLAETYFDSINSSYFQDYEKKWNRFVAVLKDKSENIDNELVIIEKYAPWFSTNENVEYLLSHKDLIIDRLHIKNVEWNKMYLKEFDIEKNFLKLNSNQKIYLLGTEFSFNFLKNNKYLIIIGSYDFGSPLITSQIYISLIEKLLSDITNYFEILFKPHPLFPVSNKPKLEEFLYRHNIKILPARMPIEVVLWDNQNIDIAGFCSTVNSLIEPTRSIAFFGEIFGFSKLLNKANRFNSKIYNVEVSQPLASAINSEYYENIGRLNAIDVRLNAIDLRLKAIDENFKAINERFLISEQKITQLVRKLNKLLIPFKPFLYIKRKIFK
jgi:hypothetical protein